jgi:hypothetical protein
VTGRRAPAARNRDRAAARARADRDFLGPLSLALLAGFCGLLLFAPPDSNAFWGVNGLRSLAERAVPLVIGAVLLGMLAAFAPRSRLLWIAIAVALAVLVAFPLRERIHFLGDTQLRLRALQAAGAGMLPAVFADWWGRLHANPLDIVINVIGPLAMGAFGFSMRSALSTVSLVLALIYLAGSFRLASRLGAAPALRGPLALALAMSGVLEAFAGYADSAGLVAAAAIWWWAELFAPLKDRRQTTWTAAAFAALLLSHRAAVLALLPQILRSLGPGIPGDRPEPRRLLLGLTLGAAALVAMLAFWSGATQQIGADLTELLRSARAFSINLMDPLNTLLLVAPLAFLAPILAWRARAGFTKDPRLLWVASGALPLLLLLIWLFPLGESGLGAHRDWDASVLLGVTLTAGAGVLLSRLEEPKLERALVLALPLLTAGALGWVAVNAATDVAGQRAMTLATRPSALTRAQRSHLHAFLGQRAMDMRRPDLAGPEWDQAFELSGNPRRALIAAEAWLLAGDREAAKRALAKARAGDRLSAELDSSARVLERIIDNPR